MFDAVFRASHSAPSWCSPALKMPYLAEFAQLCSGAASRNRSRRPGRPTRTKATRRNGSSERDVRCCEGFRMPAAHGPCRAHRRPAYENLQGRKPRDGDAERCRGHAAYGDLRVGRDGMSLQRSGRRTWLTACDCDGGGRRGDRRGDTGMVECVRRREAMITSRGASWPVESRRQIRASVERRERATGVMRCRS